MKKNITLFLLLFINTTIFASPATIFSKQESVSLSSYIKYSSNNEIDSITSDSLNPNILKTEAFNLFATSNTEDVSNLELTIKLDRDEESEEENTSLIRVVDENNKSLSKKDDHTYVINHIIDTGTILNNNKIDCFYLALDKDSIDNSVENYQVTIHIDFTDK